MNRNARADRKFSWSIAFVFVALIFAASALFVFFRLESWPARTAHQGTQELERVARDVRNAFVDIAHLQPRVTIANRVYLEKTMPTAELAVITQQVEVEHEFEHTWAGSTKRVKLHGTFEIKAGFDLRDDVSVNVRPNEIAVEIPHAKILGVEQKRVEVLTLENGFWNRVSAADLESEIAALPELAREKAAENNLPAQAERAIETQLEQRIHAGRPLQLIFSKPAGKG